ncbi:MAG: hypothetical protein RSA65_05325, partial [Clostridia bacterium]
PLALAKASFLNRCEKIFQSLHLRWKDSAVPVSKIKHNKKKNAFSIGSAHPSLHRKERGSIGTRYRVFCKP